jgi:tRNA pseudouridine65 synthase
MRLRSVFHPFRPDGDRVRFAASMEPIRILYRDDDLVAAHKPAGLLVHRTSLDAREPLFLLQLLRDQIGAHVHPVHRLDKGTSGIVVFALHAEAARRLGAAFLADEVTKVYLAVVRGWAPAAADVDHPLRDVSDRFSPRKTLRTRRALTHVRCLSRIELPTAVGRYATARYSLVECRPRSGRRHQIRRHLKHLRHPVIGDANYGDGAHNRFFRETLRIPGLLLASTRMTFRHPSSGVEIDLHSPLVDPFQRLLQRPEWKPAAGPAILAACKTSTAPLDPSSNGPR